MQLFYCDKAVAHRSSTHCLHRVANSLYPLTLAGTSGSRASASFVSQGVAPGCFSPVGWFPSGTRMVRTQTGPHSKSFECRRYCRPQNKRRNIKTNLAHRFTTRRATLLQTSVWLIAVGQPEPASVVPSGEDGGGWTVSSLTAYAACGDG